MRSGKFTAPHWNTGGFQGSHHRVHIGVEEKMGKVDLPSQLHGAYITSLLVMVDRVKRGGHAPPTLTAG